jgi:hypothetical protein
MKQGMLLLVSACLTTTAWAQGVNLKQQTEEEFQRLMPLTGTVKTMAGDFKLDHSFAIGFSCTG